MLARCSKATLIQSKPQTSKGCPILRRKAERSRGDRALSGAAEHSSNPPLLAHQGIWWLCNMDQFFLDLRESARWRLVTGRGIASCMYGILRSVHRKSMTAIGASKASVVQGEVWCQRQKSNLHGTGAHGIVVHGAGACVFMHICICDSCDAAWLYLSNIFSSGNQSDHPIYGNLSGRSNPIFLIWNRLLI